MLRWRRRWCRRAHPRSRGEHASSSTWRARSTGSSPLTRGAPCDRNRFFGGLRLIPAHAGSTMPGRACWAIWRAHPRSRGEHQRFLLIMLGHYGSSPLTRGARGSDRGEWKSGGLIPAHAGSTPTAPAASAAIWAHPRSRGEHHARYVRPRNGEGSSPLTRGAHLLNSRNSSLKRILHTTCILGKATLEAPRGLISSLLFLIRNTVTSGLRPSSPSLWLPRLSRSRHQGNPVKIRRFPMMSVSLELHSLLIRG